MDVAFSRVWAMPSSSTFTIPPIRALIRDLVRDATQVCDPFVNHSPFRAYCVSNDIDPDIPADFHLDALDFLRSRDDGEFDLVLYDPPYSNRQVSEVYRRLGRTVDMETTQSSFWGDLKREVRRVTALNGLVVACGWNSGGIGGGEMRLERVLLVPHGGAHNDTIVTVERRVSVQLTLY